MNEITHYQNLAHQNLSCISAHNTKRVNDKYWTSVFKYFDKAAKLLEAELKIDMSALIAAAIKRNDKEYLAELKLVFNKQIKVRVVRNGRDDN